MFLLVLILLVVLITAFIMSENAREAANIHKALDDMQEIARTLNTGAALILLEVIVEVFAKKYCWKTEYMNHAKAVQEYVKHRREYITMGEK